MKAKMYPKQVIADWKAARDKNPFKDDISLKRFLELQGVHPSQLNRAVSLSHGSRPFTVDVV